LWVVLKDVVRRDRDTGEARQVCVTVDETKEFGICHGHACVNFGLAPDPNAPAQVAPVPSSHPGVWRRGRQTHPGGAYAVSGDRGGDHRPRLPRRDRSRSASPPAAMEANWPTRASSSAVVALFGSARVRDVRVRAPRGAAVSAEAHAWMFQVTGLRRAVERADDRGVESALATIGQAVACAVDGDANYGRFAQHLQAIQPEEVAAPTRFNAQSVLGRRAHADGEPSGRAPPPARNTRARSVSQESGASVGSRHTCRRYSRRSDEEEELRDSLFSD